MTTPKTAADYRADAARHHEQAAASFDRCDTDGFVSQWASDMNGRLAERSAEIADAGGVWTFERTVLEALDGEPVADARCVKTKYGERWRVDSADVWLPYMPARVSTLAKRGYRETIERVVAPARAIHWAPARGGATSVQVIIIRTDTERRDGWRPAGAPQS